MDIYGYPAYPYNQSDELARQMFAQQAFAAQGPYRGIPEPHNMPAPTGAPWNVQGLPWSMQSPPKLVQFTAQTPLETKASPVLHCKRKSLDVEPVISFADDFSRFICLPPALICYQARVDCGTYDVGGEIIISKASVNRLSSPAKQFITEEKMAQHLSGLHISSNYTQHSLASDDVMEVGIDTSSLSEKLKGHTIVLSEDVKKVKEEPILPAALIERLEKPQMSLVVWKPRENIILEKIKEENDQQKSDEETPKKRNGVLVLDHTKMDMEM